MTKEEAAAKFDETMEYGMAFLEIAHERMGPCGAVHALCSLIAVARSRWPEDVEDVEDVISTLNRLLDIADENMLHEIN